MKKTIKIYKDLPLEVNKTYKTKFQTGESFLIKEIPNPLRYNVYGIYEQQPHLGIVTIAIDRLIPERIEDGTMDICDKCNELL